MVVFREFCGGGGAGFRGYSRDGFIVVLVVICG